MTQETANPTRIEVKKFKDKQDLEAQLKTMVPFKNNIIVEHRAGIYCGSTGKDQYRFIARVTKGEIMKLDVPLAHLAIKRGNIIIRGDCSSEYLREDANDTDDRAAYKLFDEKLRGGGL